MKKICILFLSVFLVLFVPNSASALEAFNIDSYDIGMKVSLDNSFEITENLDVTFSEQRHGIIRSIPLRTNGGRTAKISDISVPGYNYDVYSENGYLNIKIGDPESFTKQKETYTISYVYAIGYDYMDNMDELYFNLIGTQWDCYVDKVAFKIEMPKEFDAQKLNFTYGQAGSTDNSKVSYKVDGNTIIGSLGVTLNPQEALTVALPLEDGYFSEAFKKKTFADFAEKYYFIMLPSILLLGALLWLKKGKSNAIIKTVEFYAPDGVTSADVGFIIDNSVEAMDVTSLIIYWADRGYLTIEEQTKQKAFSSQKYFVLHKVKDMEEEAKAYEKVMFDSLFDEFGNGSQVSTLELENKFYSVMNVVRDMVKSSWQDDPKNVIYKKYNKALSFFIGFMALGVAWLGFLSAANHMKLGEFVIMAGLSLLLAVIVVAPMWLIMYTTVRAKYTAKRAGFVFGMIGMVIINALAVFLALFIGYILEVLPAIIIAVSASAILMMMSFSCTKKTEAGDRYIGLILGFREFLETAEKDRINMLVEENPQYFYDTLPFAMVMGVTDKWAHNFEDIVTQPPNWYQSDMHGSRFNTIIFAHALSNSMNGLSHSMSTSPPPSNTAGGSMGGGFSGGGSGGGGGSSW
ncbi:MAG: DUF2207 domain-containing protein [Proteocatella sp.]